MVIRGLLRGKVCRCEPGFTSKKCFLYTFPGLHFQIHHFEKGFYLFFRVHIFHTSKKLYTNFPWVHFIFIFFSPKFLNFTSDFTSFTFPHGVLYMFTAVREGFFWFPSARPSILSGRKSYFFCTGDIWTAPFWAGGFVNSMCLQPNTCTAMHIFNA